MITISMLTYLNYSMAWRDAVRGARWGLEYLDPPGDILASEQTSQ